MTDAKPRIEVSIHPPDSSPVDSTITQNILKNLSAITPLGLLREQIIRHSYHISMDEWVSLVTSGSSL
jgi:hypothetical protein